MQPKPTFDLVRAIEHELGSLAALKADLAADLWRVEDLVSLTHMLMAASGRPADYKALGERMVREGLEPYRAAAETFLERVLHGE